jgi:DNA-binding MarR family transcriptional regulator
MNISNPASLDDLATNMQRLIHQIMKQVETIDQRNIGQSGITVAQGYTLLAFPPDTTVSMSQLSDHVGNANSTTTRIIDQLVDKGLVYRATAKEDRRIVQVGLTEKGQQLRDELDLRFQGCFKQVLEDIHEDQRLLAVQTIEQVNLSLARLSEA